MFAESALIVSRLFFVGLLLETLETFNLRRQFDGLGVFSSANLAIMTSSLGWQLRAGATLGQSTAVTAAAATQALAAMTVILLGFQRSAGVIAALLCLMMNAYLRSRRQIGGSGADQLTFIVLLTFGLVMLAGGSDPARRIGDSFIAAQLVLAYFAAGISKAASPIWRNGKAMSAILSTEGYGFPTLGKFLISHPELDRLFCWSVIAWECTFPFVLVAPKVLMVAILAIGVLFHVSCAVVMGLNRFVWAFCGCYPAVWATAMLLK